LPKLVPGATAVVIGTGGLGHVAIQLLRAMTAARVIALDVTEEKLDLARAVGAHEAVLSDEKAAARVMDLTGGLGAHVVLDFVGAPPTVETAGAVARVDGDVTIVGIGGGGLAAGVAVAVKALRPDVKVIGVQAAGAAAYPPSLKVGHPVSIDNPNNMADGIKVGRPGDVPFKNIGE
ncbi:pyridoxal-phosphate dependent enzyme, partial [Streptomyces sp. SID12501]|uniref:pyridoxal-phosphate dependent enzyme n=1 Tax=Streptomyces sp. SID12501 TaxID=2706042 RepID=UPI001EF3A123